MSPLPHRSRRASPPLLVATVCLLTASGAAATARDGGALAGTWARGDGGAVVRIARCGEAWCAENTWVAPDRRDREAVGDVLEMLVGPRGADRYVGTAWDRRRDTRYSISIEITPDRLDTRGCVLVGLLCVDMTFTRVTGSAAR